MINCLDWVHLQSAISSPVQGTTASQLSFDCWYFDVQFPGTIYLSWELDEIVSVAKISFVEKINEVSYFSLAKSNSLPICEKFTLSELFRVLWEIQKVYESKEYQFIKEVVE